MDQLETLRRLTNELDGYSSRWLFTNGIPLESSDGYGWSRVTFKQFIDSAKAVAKDVGEPVPDWFTDDLPVVIAKARALIDVGDFTPDFVAAEKPAESAGMLSALGILATAIAIAKWG